jgi:tripartite-type tricarboxylate transporter receptor subunit TctC
MACLLFNSAAGLKPTSVPYKGTGPAMNDLTGGHVDYLCEQAVSVTGAINGGNVKALAVSSSVRLASLPKIPTAKEAGLNYQMSIWAGIFAPTGTPKAAVGRLAGALSKALDEQAVKDRLAKLGGSVPTKAERDPAKFAAFVKTEIARWSPILKAAAKTKK